MMAILSVMAISACEKDEEQRATSPSSGAKPLKKLGGFFVYHPRRFINFVVWRM